MVRHSLGFYYSRRARSRQVVCEDVSSDPSRESSVLEGCEFGAILPDLLVRFTGQNAKHIPIFSILLILTPLVMSWLRFQVDLHEIHAPDMVFHEYALLDPLSILPVCSVIQLLLFYTFSGSPDFVKQYFRVYQFAFAAVAITLMITHAYVCPFVFGRLENLVYVWPFEETTVLALCFTMTVGLFKIMWTQFLVLSVYTAVLVLSIRWIAVDSLPYNHRCWFADGASSAIFCLSVYLVTACIKYTLELLLRRDFVLSHSLVRESDRTERLLENVLPSKIAQKLKDMDAEGEEEGMDNDDDMSELSYGAEFRQDPTSSIVLAEKHHHTSIVHIDVVNFTAISSTLAPAVLVALLNNLFTVFDALAEKHGLEKIKTVGDAYVAAAGVPETNPHHALAACRFAFELVEFVRDSLNVIPQANDDSRYANGPPRKNTDMTRCATPDSVSPRKMQGAFGVPGFPGIAVRVGVDSGAVVGGVIGTKRFQYELWGACMEGARLMEQAADVNSVHISPNTYALVHDAFDAMLCADGNFTLLAERPESASVDYRPEVTERPAVYRRRISSSFTDASDNTAGRAGSHTGSALV